MKYLLFGMSILYFYDKDVIQEGTRQPIYETIQNHISTISLPLMPVRP